jgi:hypothetical protein
MAIPSASFLFGGSLAKLVRNQFFLGLLPRFSGDGLLCLFQVFLFFGFFCLLIKKNCFVSFVQCAAPPPRQLGRFYLWRVEVTIQYTGWVFVQSKNPR